MTATRSILDRARSSEAGFTMIVAIGVMFVTSLLLVAAFTLAIGEVEASHNDLARKQSYYAALAGVQEYEYELQANPDYWQQCTGPSHTVPGEAHEHYEVKVLGASSAPAEFKEQCSSSSPFLSAIESKGPLANTFRIQSVGYAGTAKRTLIATFKVTGFLDYIYFTNFETEDPELYGSLGEKCAGKEYKTWSKEGLSCHTIVFTSGDSVNGPMHTNDSARVEGSASFGRSGQSPPDKVEIWGGTYPEDSNFECKGGQATFNTSNKCYEKGEKIEIPENDTSLSAYVESANEFSGETHIVLEGATNTYSVVRYENGSEVKESGLKWPKNGLIYVTANGACSYPYSPSGADTSEEIKQRESCGDVWISGSYKESLTVAAENNLVITGNVYPTSVEGKLGSEPTGTATLGLIASNFVRVYHPVKNGCGSNLNSTEDPNHWGSLTNPWIYAAILSTSHSFIVDNFSCGSELGKLNEYGAIAQDYRGPVGTTGGTGYLKDYKYDGRLATDEPPYFLAPLKAGWKVIRETAN